VDEGRDVNGGSDNEEYVPGAKPKSKSATQVEKVDHSEAVIKRRDEDVASFNIVKGLGVTSVYLIFSACGDPVTIQVGLDKGKEKENALGILPVTIKGDIELVCEFLRTAHCDIKQIVHLDMDFIEQLWILRNILSEAIEKWKAGGLTEAELEELVCLVNENGERIVGKDIIVFQTLTPSYDADGMQTFFLYWIAIHALIFTCLEECFPFIFQLLSEDIHYVKNACVTLRKLPVVIKTSRQTQGHPPMGPARTTTNWSTVRFTNAELGKKYQRDRSARNVPGSVLSRRLLDVSITDDEAVRLAEGLAKTYAAVNPGLANAFQIVRDSAHTMLTTNNSLIHVMLVRKERGSERVVTNKNDVKEISVENFAADGTTLGKIDPNDLSGGEPTFMVWECHAPLATADKDTPLRPVIPLPPGYFQVLGSLRVIDGWAMSSAFVDNVFTWHIIRGGGSSKIVIQVTASGRRKSCFITIYFYTPYSFTICLGFSFWFIVQLGYSIATPHREIKVEGIPKSNYAWSCDGQIRTYMELSGFKVNVYNARSGEIKARYGSVEVALKYYADLNGVSEIYTPGPLTFMACLVADSLDVETIGGYIYLFETSKKKPIACDKVKDIIFNLTRGQRVTFEALPAPAVANESVPVGGYEVPDPQYPTLDSLL